MGISELAYGSAKKSITAINMAKEHEVKYTDAYTAVVNGYTHCVELSRSQYNKSTEATAWCNENKIGWMLATNSNHFFFRNGEAATMFKLYWG